MRPVNRMNRRNYAIIATKDLEDGSHLVYLGEAVCIRGGCQVVHGYSTRVNPDESLLLTTLYVSFDSRPLSPNAIEILLEMVSANSLYWHSGRESVPIDRIFSQKPIEQGDFLRLQRKLKLDELHHI